MAPVVETEAQTQKLNGTSYFPEPLDAEGSSPGISIQEASVSALSVIREMAANANMTMKKGKNTSDTKDQGTLPKSKLKKKGGAWGKLKENNHFFQLVQEEKNTN